jgi:hypothetical protein
MARTDDRTELWMAWSDDGRYLVSIFGSSRSRAEMQRIIKGQKRGKDEPLRPVRVNGVFDADIFRVGSSTASGSGW